MKRGWCYFLWREVWQEGSFICGEYHCVCVRSKNIKLIKQQFLAVLRDELQKVPPCNVGKSLKVDQSKPSSTEAFRQRGAGDILRDVYQSLTADPHSLANLDQAGEKKDGAPSVGHIRGCSRCSQIWFDDNLIRLYRYIVYTVYVYIIYNTTSYIYYICLRYQIIYRIYCIQYVWGGWRLCHVFVCWILRETYNFHQRGELLGKWYDLP